VDLTRYRYEASCELPLVCYRLHGATLSTQSLPPTESQTVDFQPGEAILWLLRARSAASGQADPNPPSVRFTQPLPNAILQGEIEIAASVADDVGVVRVDLLVDGQPIGKLRTSLTTSVVWSGIALLLLWCLVPLAPAAERLPNLILIVADDLGYADVGMYGAKGFTTPNLDRLAREGIRFTDFHVAQAVCSASRAAIMTGSLWSRTSKNAGTWRRNIRRWSSTCSAWPNNAATIWAT
jgi:hypothetical protein